MEGNPFAHYKLLRHPERIAEWLRCGRSRPIVVDFALTNRCPHRCPACPGEWRNDPKAHWDADAAIETIGDLGALGALAVSFGGGGEPLAHPECVDVFEATKALGLSVGIITNGAILRKGWAERICKVASWVRVSVDAATPETFGRIHGVPENRFDTILDNIRELVAVRRRETPIGFAFLTGADTVSEIEPAAKLAASLGVDYIQFRPFNHDQTDVSTEIAHAKQFDRNGFRVLSSGPKYELIKAGRIWRKPYTQCAWARAGFDAVLTASGDLQVCCDHRGPEGRIGSVLQENLKDLWYSRKREEVLDRLGVSTCPPMCRGNSHNLLLTQVAHPLTHEEFV